MAEYTAYTMIHIDDIAQLRARFALHGIGAALELDETHPCRAEPACLDENWLSLPYHQKWAIVLSRRPVRQMPEVKLWAKLLIDEDPRRWRFQLDDGVRSLDLLFSDRPWGDYCDFDEGKDWDRIARANSLSAVDIEWMEACFAVPRARFQPYLRMGHATYFLRAVGLPYVELFEEEAFLYSFPRDLNRCILWDELEVLLD